MAAGTEVFGAGTIDQWNGRLPRDHGPIYTETLHNLPAYFADGWRMVEPCNAVTASVFIFIAAFWLVRLRGRYRRHPFVMSGLVILLVGGIGGTVYHAFRQWPIFLAMDFVPISLLSLMAAIYLWVRLRPQWYFVVLIIVGIVLLMLAMVALRPPGQMGINVGYLM